MHVLALATALGADSGDLAFTFSTGATVAVNAVLAIIMLGVGLDLDLGEFRRTLRAPRGPLVGAAAQFLFLPAVAFGFILLTDPDPAVAVGMLLVASCPGGTTSNIVTHLADGNTSLSIAMTTLSTFVALVMTPFNIAFYGSRIPAIEALGIDLDPVALILALVLVMGLPVLIGAVIQVRLPVLAGRLLRPMRIVAVVGMLVIVIGAVAANLGNLSGGIGRVLVAVVIVNGLALTIGYFSATAMRLPVRDRRAMSIEVGIQNSALALSLSLKFFPALTGAAVLAALWGMWHLVSGLSLARIWSGHSLFRPAPGHALGHADL